MKLVYSLTVCNKKPLIYIQEEWAPLIFLGQDLAHLIWVQLEIVITYLKFIFPWCFMLKKILGEMESWCPHIFIIITDMHPSRLGCSV